MGKSGIPRVRGTRSRRFESGQPDLLLKSRWFKSSHPDHKAMERVGASVLGDPQKPYVVALGPLCMRDHLIALSGPVAQGEYRRVRVRVPSGPLSLASVKAGGMPFEPQDGSLAGNVGIVVA